MVETKETIMTNIIVPLDNPQLFVGGGGSHTAQRNILMWGPPGTGKTMIALKTAAITGALFVGMSQSDLMGGYLVDLPMIIKGIYLAFRMSGRKCIIFVDEAEAMIAKRGAPGEMNQAMDAVVQEFMINIEDNTHTEPVFTIFATNIPANIDSAINSRIGAKIPVWIPGPSERQAQLQKAFKKAIKQGIAEESILQTAFVNKIVKMTKWRSFRTITNTLKKAWNEPIREYLHTIIVNSGKVHVKIQKENLPLATQGDIIAAFEDTESSFKACEELTAWAHANHVELDKYVDPELRFQKPQATQSLFADSARTTVPAFKKALHTASAPVGAFKQALSPE